MPNWTRELTRLITVRYWIALILIALFVTASYFVLKEAIETQREGIRIVRKAAQQQVASQRICFLAHAMIDESDDDERRYYRSTLRRAIDEMEQRNDVLTLRDSSSRVPRRIEKLLRDIYFEGADPFDKKVGSFIRNARKVAETDDSNLRDDLPELLRINYAGSRQIMQTHTLIYGLLRQEAYAAVDRIYSIGTILWVLTLILLAIEVPMIFRPMTQRAARTLNVMELTRRKAQRDAAAAHAAREGQASFIRTMSHELRTPLNAILGMTQLMKMAPRSEKRDEYVDDIHHAGQHLLGLINDILELSRLQAGQVVVHLSRICLQEELERTVSLLRPLASRRGLELTCRLDQKLAENYRADGSRIRQILLNLIGNAVKFTESGSVEIRAFYIGAAGAANDIVRFEVEDTGIGVPPDLQEKIFDEFQQADASLARKFGGSGLGLAISSRLVRLMRGKIGVQSSAGKGSVFWFEIPLERVSSQERGDAAMTVGGRRTRRLNVLLVKGSEAGGFSVEGRLRARGHDVRIVSPGRDATVAAMASAPDVIIMDLVSFEDYKNGAARIARSIRAIPGPAGGAFMIAMGAKSAEDCARSIIKAGVDICLDGYPEFEVLDEYLTEFAQGRWSARTA